MHRFAYSPERSPLRHSKPLLIGVLVLASTAQHALAMEPCQNMPALGCLEYFEAGDDLIEGMGLTDYSLARPTIALSIYLHFAAAPDSSTYGESDIPTIMQDLAFTYGNRGIDLHVVGFDYHEIDPNPSLCPPQRAGDTNEHRIDGVILRNVSAGGGAEDPYVLRFSAGDYGCNEPHAHTIAHELGHSLGLQHTHHQALSLNAPTPCGYIDVSQNPPQANGYFCGDWVPDNGYLPQDLAGVLVDPATCSWYPLSHPNWNTYAPQYDLVARQNIVAADPRNIMNYFNNACSGGSSHCGYNLTPDQAARIKVNVEFNRQDYGLIDVDAQGNGYVFWGAIYPQEEIVTPDLGGALLPGEYLEWTEDMRYFDGKSILDSVIVVVRDAQSNIVFDSGGLVPNVTPFTSWTPSAADAGELFTADVTFKQKYSPYTHTESVSFTVLAPVSPLAYVDVTSQTDIGTQSGSAQPYAAVAADLDGDGDRDLFVTDQRADRPALWLRHDDHQNPAYKHLPQFVDARADLFPPAAGIAPQGLRGASIADFDNDGDLDIFAAGAGNTESSMPRLYQFDGSTYADIGPSIGAGTTLAGLAAQSWMGAWGDYDRDGRIDLYIGRAATSGSGLDAKPGSALADVLLHNDGAELFSDASALGINSGGNAATGSASWADFDGDHNLDLLVADYSGGDLRLYRNTIHPDNGQSFVHRDDLLPTSPFSIPQVSALSWADLDNDGDLDAVLGRRNSSSPGIHALWNDGGGAFSQLASLGGSDLIGALLVADEDLNGTLDILAARDVASQTSNALQYWHNNPVEPGQHFTEAAASVSLGTATNDRVTALASSDFGGSRGSGGDQDDGDLELYVGRAAASGEVFFQATTSGVGDDPTGRWLRITLAPHPTDPYSTTTYGYGNNARGIGAIVTVYVPNATSPTWQQAQVVDGGSGLGGQGNPTLTFGLGPNASSADVEVIWPDGYTQTDSYSSAGLDQEHVFHDDHTPSFLGSSIAVYRYPTPLGNLDWYVEWESDFSTDPTQDEVWVEFLGQYGTKTTCLDPGFTAHWLNPDSPDVEHAVTPTQWGTYRHRLIWKERPCFGGCQYQFRVRSKVTELRKETSQMKTFVQTGCMY